ncbi:hypothetical protein BCR33DRAFT_723475 [Rhizoclosmatium globosum]|uniref:G-protein coupled receptors family 1 profile domain-containing protein n=1 Tax=Rhizoclosmatium globosum TaxID=329046 RepID=A0A1Y2BEF0_9FUNG|nr:hypothetical protein BCR33DRAFT_723475 [Rhizoclosmatium globosum]|eukprot:ORY32455.1 hypothetical protein BCR33DRAFT_723475 [Rhizoclosmatium globosum]
MTVSESTISAFSSIAYIIPAIVSGLSFLILFLFIIFLIRVELPGRHQPLTFSNFFTRSNTFLLLMWIGGGVDAASISIWTVNGLACKPMWIASTISLTLVEYSYLAFSFDRSVDILKRQWSPVVVKGLQILIYLQVVVGLTPIFVSAGDGGMTEVNVLVTYGVGGLLMCFMDLFFVASFSLYIRSLKADMKEVDLQINPQLKIIARYGYYGCLANLTTIILFSVAYACRIISNEADSWFVAYLAIRSLMDVAAFGTGLVITSMRFALFRNYLEQAKSAASDGGSRGSLNVFTGKGSTVQNQMDQSKPSRKSSNNSLADSKQSSRKGSQMSLSEIDLSRKASKISIHEFTRKGSHQRSLQDLTRKDSQPEIPNVPQIRHPSFQGHDPSLERK